MSSPNAEDFFDALDRMPTPDALVAIESVVEEAAPWSPQKCREWLAAALAYSPHDHCLEPELLKQAALRLAESVLHLLAKTDSPELDESTMSAIEDLTCYNLLLDVPRRLLVSSYVQWIENGFLPGVAVYRLQVTEKSTKDERIAFAHAIGKVDTLSDEYPTWLRETLQDVLELQPHRLRHWLEELRRCGNEFDAIVVERHTRWMEQIPGVPRLPSELQQWCRARRPSASVVQAAARALAANDTWRIDRQDLQLLIEREMATLEPRLPSTLASALGPLTRNLLGDYLRLSACEGTSPIALCSLLSLAMESHVREVLGADLQRPQKDALESAGLADVASLLAGRTTHKLQGLEVDGQAPPPQLVEALTRTGTYRNQVHHSPSKLRATANQELHNLWFATGHRSPEWLDQLAAVRLRRKT